jgi:UDP-2,3-diacylglucosamine pyrophosphatase LpxH
MLACAACASSARAPTAARRDADDRFALAQLDDRALCDQLLARTADAYAVFVDREPRTRREVIVSDLHLGPGASDPRFTGIEDFYSDAEWTAFLARQGERGPTDLVIDGDFIEFWQIAAALGVLPKRDASVQPPTGTMLAEDQDFGITAVDLVIAAHPTVFSDLGRFLGSGDHRVIVIPGNHDADLLWPKVQRQIERAIAPADPTRLVFVQAAAYEHAGVHIEHGHAHDAANAFATSYAPFGRDREGKCRIQASWGEVFVDQFYTETERQIPFIDNLYPESAAILWELEADPRGVEHGLGAGVRFLELIRTAESRALNRNAAKAVLQSVFGTPGSGDKLAAGDVLDQLTQELAHGDTGAVAIVTALWRLRTEPDLASLWTAIVRAGQALPDLGAAMHELAQLDPSGLSRLRDRAFGDVEHTVAARLLGPGIRDVVFAHTHQVGGAVAPIQARGVHGYFANTGSWISVASVAELQAKRIGWAQLSLADRTMFPSKNTAVVIEFPGGVPGEPVIENAK